MAKPTRLAIVTTHPIQYYAPWFRYLDKLPDLEIRVFYLWDFGVRAQVDQGFGQTLTWDIPLLDGYANEFVPNVSAKPGTNHFAGIDNPQLAERLLAFEPSAVLCLGYNYRSFLRLIFRRQLPGLPLLMRGDSHRLVPRRGLRPWLARQAVSFIFRHFRAFPYVGVANREYFRAQGVPEKRLFFSPHAVDNARFMADPEATQTAAQAWKRELGIAPDHQVVLFAGKFEDKKRPLDLLAAFQQAAVRGVSLLMVGAGHLESVLRERAATIANVHFAPFQNQSFMPRTYATGDLLVLPSFGSGETWGLCVNEAQCLGLPVIVSSHVGCAADLVLPGETGWVFPAGSVAALAESLREALADRGRLRRMGMAARDRINRYSYATASAGLLEAVAAATAETKW